MLEQQDFQQWKRAFEQQWSDFVSKCSVSPGLRINRAMNQAIQHGPYGPFVDGHDGHMFSFEAWCRKQLETDGRAARRIRGIGVSLWKELRWRIQAHMDVVDHGNRVRSTAERWRDEIAVRR